MRYSFSLDGRVTVRSAQRLRVRLAVAILLTLGVMTLASPVRESHAANGMTVFGTGPQQPQGGANAPAQQPVFETDPATGMRIMRTPPPPVQDNTYQGPDTIIVSPEVYPGSSGNNAGNNGWSNGGNRPGNTWGNRPGNTWGNRPGSTWGNRPGYPGIRPPAVLPPGVSPPGGHLPQPRPPRVMDSRTGPSGAFSSGAAPRPPERRPGTGDSVRVLPPSVGPSFGPKPYGYTPVPAPGPRPARTAR